MSLVKRIVHVLAGNRQECAAFVIERKLKGRWHGRGKHFENEESIYFFHVEQHMADGICGDELILYRTYAKRFDHNFIRIVMHHCTARSNAGTAVVMVWLRARNGRTSHARIGERDTFACRKPVYRNATEECVRSASHCEECRSVIGFLEDQYGGATD